MSDIKTRVVAIIVDKLGVDEGEVTNSKESINLRWVHQTALNIHSPA